LRVPKIGEVVVVGGDDVEAFVVSVTTGVAGDVADADPFWFEAVTVTRTVAPLSVEVRL
jgi:hypothetical protein